MYVGFAAPRLVVYSIDDGAVGADGIQASFSRLVVADVLGANQPGAAGDQVLRGARRQVVVGAAEPIRAKIGAARNLRIGFLNSR